MGKKLIRSSLFLFLFLLALVFIDAKTSFASNTVLLAQSGSNRSCGMTCGSTAHGPVLRCASPLICVVPPGPRGGLGRCVLPGCTWANRTTCCSVLSVTPAISSFKTTGTPLPTTFSGLSPTLPPVDTGLSGTPVLSPSTPVSITGSSSLISDCAGVGGPGVSDGKVDLIDIDQLRKELSKQVTTTFCDIDKNGTVDIIDFTDYMRKDFIAIQPLR